MNHLAVATALLRGKRSYEFLDDNIEDVENAQLLYFNSGIVSPQSENSPVTVTQTTDISVAREVYQIV